MYRPSDSDIVDSVVDDDDDVAKPSSASVSHSSKPVSVPEVRSSPPPQSAASVELVNEKSSSAVSVMSTLHWFQYFNMHSLLISAPSLGVYCQQLTLSVCPDVRLSRSFKLLLLFCFSMELSHFWPSFLHMPLYKTLFFDF